MQKAIFVFLMFTLGMVFTSCGDESDTCGDIDYTCMNKDSVRSLKASLKLEPSEVGINENFLVDASATTGADKVIIRIEGQQICAGKTGCYHQVSESGVYQVTVKAMAKIGDGKETDEVIKFLHVLPD